MGHNLVALDTKMNWSQENCLALISNLGALFSHSFEG